MARHIGAVSHVSGAAVSGSVQAKRSALRGIGPVVDGEGECARGTEVDDWARMAKEPLLRWCGRSSCHVHVG